MSEPEATRVAKEAYAAFNRGDIPGVLSVVADDVDWFVAGPSTIPTAGPRRGKAQVSEFFEILGKSMDPVTFEPQNFIAQGDKVAVQGNYKWAVKSTGKQWDSDWCHVFTVRNGKIVGFKEYFDTAAGVEGYHRS